MNSYINLEYYMIYINNNTNEFVFFKYSPPTESHIYRTLRELLYKGALGLSRQGASRLSRQ